LRIIIDTDKDNVDDLVRIIRFLEGVIKRKRGLSNNYNRDSDYDSYNNTNNNDNTNLVGFASMFGSENEGGVGEKGVSEEDGKKDEGVNEEGNYNIELY